jgi:hypothetical protein
MKKLFFLIVVNALVISCAKGLTDNESQSEHQVLQVIYASQYTDPDTKNIIDDSNADISWTSGDAINVFFGTSLNSKFVTSEAGEVAQFKGSIDVVLGGGEGLNDDTYLWGVYPYSAQNKCGGSTITLTLPATQPAAENTFAKGLFPQIAKSKNFYMSFYNLCGGFRFSVSSPDIKTVTLSGNNNELIAGKVKVGMETVPVVDEMISGETKLTMHAPDGGYFKPGVHYYFVLFPTQFTTGLTLTYYKDETHASYVYSKAYELKRGNFPRFANRDQGLTFVPTPLNNWGEGENIGGEI